MIEALECTTVDTEPIARVRRRLVAGLLAVAAVTAAVNMLARPVDADDWADYAIWSASRDGAWAFSLVGGVATGVAYATVGLAACLLVQGRGALAATVGAAMTGLGGLAFTAGFFALGTLNWYSTSPALSAESGQSLFSLVNNHGAHAFAPQAVGFLLGTLGCFVIAVALWRSRIVPRWLPAAIPVTFVLMMLGGSGIAYGVAFALFMATLVVVAMLLWRSGGDDPASVRQ